MNERKRRWGKYLVVALLCLLTAAVMAKVYCDAVTSSVRREILEEYLGYGLDESISRFQEIEDYGMSEGSYTVAVAEYNYVLKTLYAFWAMDKKSEFDFVILMNRLYGEFLMLNERIDVEMIRRIKEVLIKMKSPDRDWREFSYDFGKIVNELAD